MKFLFLINFVQGIFGLSGMSLIFELACDIREERSKSVKMDGFRGRKWTVIFHGPCNMDHISIVLISNIKRIRFGRTLKRRAG